MEDEARFHVVGGHPDRRDDFGPPPDKSGVAIEVGHSRHAILGESDVISWRELDIVEVGHFKLLAVDVK